jgi:hypothetical protein
LPYSQAKLRTEDAPIAGHNTQAALPQGSSASGCSTVAL